MSKGLPIKAFAALLPRTIKVCEGVEVRPLSLAMFAVLERINSPMVTGAEADTMELLPSLYALTHEPLAAVASQNLLADSLAWADTMPPRVIEEIKRAAEEQISAVLDVVPEPKKKAPEEAGTGGSSR